MGLVFNPFTGTFDFDSAATATSWKTPVASAAALPTAGNADGDARVTLDTDEVWVWDNSGSRWENQKVQSTSGIGSTPNSEGYSLSVNEVTADLRTTDLILQPADSTNPGILTIAAQNIAGNKTFDNNVIITGDLTVNGTTTTINTTILDVTDANISVNVGGTQASADSADAGLTIEMSDATNVVIGYDSTMTSRMKVGDAGSEQQIVTTGHTQTLENKTIDGTSSSGNNTVTTDADQVTYERADGSKKNIDSDSDDIEATTSDLDDAIGTLTAAPTNYTPTDAAIVSNHLDGIDTELGNKADRDLNNLTITSVNQSLIPSDETKDLGSAGTRWRELFLKSTGA